MYDIAGSLLGSAQQNDRLNIYVDELHKLHSILIAMPNIPAELRAVWGWLVSIMPYYFQPGNLAAGEQLGRDMIIGAYKDQPSNAFLEVLYASTIGDEEWYHRARKKMSTRWNQYFVNDDFIGTYFIAISTDVEFDAI